MTGLWNKPMRPDTLYWLLVYGPSPLGFEQLWLTAEIQREGSRAQSKAL